MIKVLKVWFGQPLPRLDKPVGVVYHDDDGLILVMGEDFEKCAEVEISYLHFEIILIDDIPYEGYIVEE